MVTKTCNKKKTKLFILFTFLLVLFTQFFTQPIYANTISNTTVNVSLAGDGITIKSDKVGNGDPILTILQKYRDALVLFSSIATITFGFFFISNILKLAGTADNPFGRKQAITGIIVCGISCSLLGGLTIIMAFFQNFLTSTK